MKIYRWTSYFLSIPGGNRAAGVTGELMKNMSRAIRRHRVARLKQARRFYFGRDNWSDSNTLGRLLNTTTPCSCWMCGNPRRYVGRTLSETLHLVRLREAS